MIAAALIAFLHQLSAFTLAACVVYEFVAFRKGMGMEEAKRIQRLDLAYGISAGLLLVIGLLRVFIFEKGINFYLHNPFFWVKMTAFVLVGLMSIYPTVRFIRWNKHILEGKAPIVDDHEFERTRLVLWLEVTGIAIILFSAPMMARAIGMN